MANQYFWGINQMTCYPTYENQQNCVFNIAWVCSATDGVNNVATYGTVDIPYVAQDVYVPYENLTFDQTMAWVNENLGADGIAAAQANCNEQLLAVATPTQIQLPLPYKNDPPVTQSPGWFSRILAALNPFS